MIKVVTSDNGSCMLLQAIHHIMPGVCTRSPTPKIFDNPSANPPSDNATPWMARSRSSAQEPLYAFVSQNASKRIDIRLLIDIITDLKRVIGSYSKSEAIAVAGMRCFIRHLKCQSGVAKIWGSRALVFIYATVRLSDCQSI